MTIPKNALGSLLEAFLFAGSVLRFKIKYPDGKEGIKRLIVVSNDNKQTTLLLTVTSNIHGEYKYYRKDDIFVPRGSEDCFERDTCIQMHRIIPRNTSKLKDLYTKNSLDILGKISNELMERIYIAINESDQIEQKFVKRIEAERDHKR